MQAWNVDTGKQVWTHPFANSQLWGPMLATGGGVVFTGGTNDRYFHAFDASNGKLLWEFRTSSGVIGVPVSFQSTASSTSPCSRAGGSMPHACRRASTWRGHGNSPRCRKAAPSGFSRCRSGANASATAPALRGLSPRGRDHSPL